MIRFVTPGAIRETHYYRSPHAYSDYTVIFYCFSVSNPLFLSLITALSFFFSSSPSLQVDSYLGNMEEKG